MLSTGKECACVFNMCVPSGLSPPFLWSPADIEVQFSAVRLPDDSPFSWALRVPTVQCWQRRMKKDREETEEGKEEKRGWKSEGTYPFYWRLSSFPSHTRSPRHILCWEAGRKGRELGGGGGWRRGERIMLEGGEGGWGETGAGIGRYVLHSRAVWDDKSESDIHPIPKLSVKSYQMLILHMNRSISMATVQIPPSWSLLVVMQLKGNKRSLNVSRLLFLRWRMNFKAYQQQCLNF